MSKHLLQTIVFISVIAALAGACSKNEKDPIKEPEIISIRLEAQLLLSGKLTDVWGYFDPSTGKEYALLGFVNNNRGVHIVDVSDPKNPVLAATVNNIPGFDVKVWQHYLYTVHGGDSGKGAIVNIADPANPQVVSSFPSSHNIFISENGYMFLEFRGLRIFDLNPDPTAPIEIWSGGNEGHDATVVGNRLYDFHGSQGTNIYDISTITNPRLLGSITLPTLFYHHSGWPTTDGKYLLICDEGARDPNDDITMWDISDPGNSTLVTGYKDSTAIVHNLYIIDDLAYVSYYNSGFKLFDVSRPGEFTLLDEFDTTPATGENFNGAFGVYPFAPSGTVYVSDMNEGLFLFSIQRTTGSAKMILAP